MKYPTTEEEAQAYAEAHIGLSRIVHPSFTGWRARTKVGGEVFQHHFSDRKYGGLRRACMRAVRALRLLHEQHGEPNRRAQSALQPKGYVQKRVRTLPARNGDGVYTWESWHAFLQFRGLRFRSSYSCQKWGDEGARYFAERDLGVFTREARIHFGLDAPLKRRRSA